MDCCDRFRNCDVFQTFAALEHLSAEFCQRVGQIDNLKRSAFVEHTHAKFVYAVGECDLRHALAQLEGISVNLLDTVWNHNFGERCTFAECIGTDCRHAVGNDDTGQFSAVGKRVLADFCNRNPAQIVRDQNGYGIGLAA